MNLAKVSLLSLAAVLFVTFKSEAQLTSEPPEITWPWTLPSDWTLPPNVSFPTPGPLPPLSEARVNAGELGIIQGSYSYTSRGPHYEAGHYYYWYTGIPYADPASYTGANRFKPSTVYTGPLRTDGEDFNGVQPYVWCPQEQLIDPVSNNITSFMNEKHVRRRERITAKLEGREFAPLGDGYMGQEDCLIVSVSTSLIQHPNEEAIAQAKLLPVIVFVHGGGFNAYWGSVFGGQRLLNDPVVLVTLNYRLGVLGSLNYGIDDAPGSALVYDCITALDWVQRYIHHFGGDKDRVTISGQSAGAVLATSVFLSPLAKGKFHGAIGDSGSALSIWATNTSPMDDHLRIATFTSCKSIIDAAPTPEDIDLQQLADCMKALSLGELVAAQSLYSDQENIEGRMGYDALVPSVQSPSLSFPRAIEESPLSVLKNKRQSDVPLMMGVTRHDGSFVFDTTYHDFLVPNDLVNNTSFMKNDFLPSFLEGVGFRDETPRAMVHALADTYLGSAKYSDNFEDMIPGLLDIHTVLGFKAGAYGLVEQHARLNPNSYYYAFDYSGMYSTYPLATSANNIIPGGVAHVDDLIYLFQLFPLYSDNDLSVTERYVSYWVNFATYGNPNGPVGDEPFPRFSQDDHRFLIINTTDSIGYYCRDTWKDNSLELMQ